MRRSASATSSETSPTRGRRLGSTQRRSASGTTSATCASELLRGERGGVVLADPRLRLDDLPERPERDPVAVGQAAAVPPGDDLLVLGRGLAQLDHEPALPDPGHADEGHELRRALDAHARERAEQQRALVLPADERRRRVVVPGAGDAAHGLDGLPHLDRVGLPLRRHGLVLAVDDRALRRAVRRGADEDPVHRRSRLDARRGVHHVTRDHRLALRRTGVERDERLAGRDPDAHMEVERVAPVVQRGDRLARGERGAHRSLGVVLVGGRGAVDRDDRVADELLDRASVSLEVTPQGLVVPTEDGAHVLRVEPLGAGGRAHEVDEDRRDDLPLFPRARLGGEGRAARVAEPGVVRVLAGAPGAHEHGPSLLRRRRPLSEGGAPCSPRRRGRG